MPTFSDPTLQAWWEGERWILVKTAVTVFVGAMIVALAGTWLRIALYGSGP